MSSLNQILFSSFIFISASVFAEEFDVSNKEWIYKGVLCSDRPDYLPEKFGDTAVLKSRILNFHENGTYSDIWNFAENEICTATANGYFSIKNNELVFKQMEFKGLAQAYYKCHLNIDYSNVHNANKRFSISVNGNRLELRAAVKPTTYSKACPIGKEHILVFEY